MRTPAENAPDAADRATLIVLLFGVSAALAREAAGFYQRIESGELDPARVLRSLFAALPEAFTELLRRFGLVDFDDPLRRLSAGLAQASRFIATQAPSIGRNTVEFIASLFVTLYLAFFLIRDGDAVLRAVSRAVPMAPAHRHELFVKFATVVRATVKGNVLVAALQGLLGGVAFWVLDTCAGPCCGAC